MQTKKFTATVRNLHISELENTGQRENGTWMDTTHETLEFSSSTRNLVNAYTLPLWIYSPQLLTMSGMKNSDFEEKIQHGLRGSTMLVKNDQQQLDYINDGKENFTASACYHDCRI